MRQFAAAAASFAMALPPTQSDATPPVNPPSVAVGSVTSSGQSGQAITTGAIGTLNQILPTLVRGPLLETFKAKFTQGARLRNAITRTDLTDEQYRELFAAADAWAVGCYAWLSKDVSEYAAERFLFRQTLGMSYSLPGTHPPEVVEKRDGLITNMAALLQNLDMLMREPSLYPQK